MYAADNQPARPPTLLQVCQAESDVGQVWLVSKCMAQTPRADTRIPTDQEQAATAAVTATHQDIPQTLQTRERAVLQAPQHIKFALANRSVHAQACCGVLSTLPALLHANHLPTHILAGTL